VGSLETIVLRSFLVLTISLTLPDIRDIIDGVILCDDLTERCPLHMGSAVISQIFCPLVGLPLPLCTPHRGPCSFLQKLYIWRDFCLLFTSLLFLCRRCCFFLLALPFSSQPPSVSSSHAHQEGCALMTHKYRGCIIVLLINKSVEPNEEQKVLTSGFDQGFTVNTSKQVFRGIW
jgi:hypothetical protein